MENVLQKACIWIRVSLTLSLSPFHVNTCNAENGSPTQIQTHTSSLYTPDFRCSDYMPLMYPCAAHNTVLATLRIPSSYCCFFFFHIQTARSNLPNRFSRFKRTFVRWRDGARSETVFNSVVYCIFAIWQIVYIGIQLFGALSHSFIFECSGLHVNVLNIRTVISIFICAWGAM